MLLIYDDAKLQRCVETSTLHWVDHAKNLRIKSLLWVTLIN